MYLKIKLGSVGIVRNPRNDGNFQLAAWHKIWPLNLRQPSIFLFFNAFRPWSRSKLKIFERSDLIYMSQTLRLGYVTAIWGREWLTKAIFSNLANILNALLPDIKLLVAVAGSEGERSACLARQFDFKYVEILNNPLGAKWNAALELLKDDDLAGVCIMGSDDLSNKEYYWELAEYIHAGADLIGLSGLYFFDHPTRRLLYWQGYRPPRQNDTAGAGRFISRKILDSLGWALWPPRINQGLDRSMRELLQGADFKIFKALPCKDGGAVVMDIKGYGGMNGFEQIAASGPSMLLGDPHAFFLKNFGPETSSDFFPAVLDKSDCTDCWLWSIPGETGEDCPVSDAPGIFYVENENPQSAQFDFLLACRQSGIDIKNCTLGAFLDGDAQSSGKRQFIYGGLSGETFFAMLGSSLPKILEWRDIEDEIYRTYALKLPVILSGYYSRKDNALPLPFSLPPGFPCFEQRAHIMLCVNDALLQECRTLKENANKFKNINLLYFTKQKRQSHEDFNELGREHLFPLRTMFKAVIFTVENWTEAAYFIAGGTPGICLGPWMDEEPPNCLISASSAAEAMSLAAWLDKDRKFWKKMAARSRFYSRQQFRHFQAELCCLFHSS